MPASKFLERDWEVLFLSDGCLKMAQARFPPHLYAAQMGRVLKNINALVNCNLTNF